MVDNNFPQNMGQPGIPMGQPVQPAGNPLAKHLRQPKIYIKLPSNGEYWPQAALKKVENGEYPVYAMTAKDEITMKTPDALLNGQATVDVIQSCFPNVIDAWQCPSIDLDAILVAIRMASYGEAIDMSAMVPQTEITKDFQLDLQTILDNLTNTVYEDTFSIPGFRVQIVPITYRHATQQAIKAFEEQRIFATVNDDALTEEVKLEPFSKSFSKLTDININVVVNSVVAIQPEGDEVAVTNKNHLREFIEGAEAGVFNAIQAHIAKQKDNFQQKPIKMEATAEEMEAGAPATYDLPITFDQSNFFGSGS